jgi:hypothetical protein
LLAVRFDEELSVAHRVADGWLPCPQGVLVTGREGVRRVVGCGDVWGHDGPCAPRHRPSGLVTACGLSLDVLPFVFAPDGCRVCPGCYDDEPAEAVIEQVML